MSLQIGDNFSYRGRKPLDERMFFNTVSEMKNYSETFLPDMYITLCKETGRLYVYNSGNTIDSVIGKWREVTFDGSGNTDVQFRYDEDTGDFYIWNGTAYIFIANIRGKDGTDGLSIEYKGELSSPPSNPIKNWTYKNSTNGIVYIYTGASWEIMTYDGDKGTDGADGSNGYSVYITYHDSTTKPDIPTGDGTTGGWHTDSTQDVIWMSQKVSSSATTGTWGAPIRIKGEKGENGTSVKILDTYNSLEELNREHPNGNENGDGYLINGDLYVWNGTYFQNVGQIKGEDGKPGADGINGKTPYVHIKYSNDGKTFTANNGESVGSWLGIYTDYNSVDSSVFSDYTWMKVQGQQGLQGVQGERGEQGIPGTNGQSSYFHIKYSNIANPTTVSQMTETPSTYIGTYVDNNPTDSTNPYTYTWYRFQGLQGEQGEQGIPGVGIDGKTSYLHIAYANSADGTVGFSIGDGTNKSYIGTYTDFIQADSIEPSKYTWSRIKGEDGLQGLQGEKGEQGIPGINGQTSYFHIKYSSVANPTTSSQMTESPSAYIGTYVDFIQADSTDPKKYTWHRFEGLQGEKGEQGIPGIGTDGRTSYLHIKYSNDGGTTFTSNNGEVVGEYIGTRTDFVQNDSSNPVDYTWAKIKGNDGLNGSDGVSVEEVIIEYSKGTSTTIPPTSGWSTSMPSYQENYFLWIRTRVKYSNSTAYVYSTPICDQSWKASQEAHTQIIQLKDKLALIATDGDNETSITLTPTFLQLLTNSGIKFKANNISLEGLVTANGGFAIDMNGNVIANNGLFNGEINAKGNMTADTLVVREVICKTLTGALQGDINISISDDGDDGATIENNAVFNTIQGCLDALPSNLNGHTVWITVNKVCSENLRFRGLSNGSIYIFMNMQDYKGYIAGYDCNARIFIYGGLTSTSISEVSNAVRPKVAPSTLVANNTYYYGMYFANCNFVTLRGLEVYGQTGNSSYYAIGAEYGSTVFVQNCKLLGSENGIQARNSKVISYNNFGKVNSTAIKGIYGGNVCIQGSTYTNGTLVVDNSSTLTYSSTFSKPDSSTTSVGNNSNTGVVTTKSVTYTSDYGDTYRYLWGDWGQDNIVTQGKWSSGAGSDNVGAWFFGNDFTELQGKTITKVVLKITRITGGATLNNEAKIVMHNYSTRPSGEPTYLSWSQTANLNMNDITTVTITNPTVLNAIKNGTMKGFGLKHTFDDTHYIKCSGSMKAIVTYQD